MKRKTKFLSFMLSASLLITSAVVPAAAASDASGYDVTACIASEPESIDPQLNTAVDGAVMIQHLFEGLMKWDDNGSGEVENATLVNGQAESFTKETVEDKTVYTFKIRDDANWSDGEPVTAADFEYAWKRLANPETASDYFYMIDMVENANEIMAEEVDYTELGIKAIDEKTLEVTLFFDCPYFLEVCAFPSTFPVREDVIEAEGDQWTFSVDTYITNGPYRLNEWSHNAYIEMVKNENYYDFEKLGPDSIKFMLMDDANAIYAAYRSGELDFIEVLPVEEIPGLVESGEMVIADYIGTYYVNFQVENPPFDDWRVRKAFTLAIDRNYIVEQITAAGQQPASGYVPAGIYDADGAGSDFRSLGGDYYSVAPEDYEANCEEARALLAEAGYPDGEGFPTVEYMYNTNASHAAIAEALQQMWKTELNVNVTLQNEEWNTFLDTRREGNYEIARNGWIGDVNDPISFIDMFLTGTGNNAAQYSDPYYDALVRLSKSTSDPRVRFAAMHDAEDILMRRDWVVAPIYYYVNTWLINEDIEGLIYTPLGYMLFTYTTR